MKNKQLSLILFLFAELYAYISLICFNDFISSKVMILIAMFLCLIISISLFCKTKDYYLMICAISISLICDIFFTFFNNLSYIGLIGLNIIQLLYFLRIYLDSDYKRSNILSRIIVLPIVTCIVILTLKEKADISAILWTWFTINLFINILFTIKEIGLNNLFPIGLLLLFIYSGCLMLTNVSNYTSKNLPLLNFIENLPFNLNYVFYIPAQVVLTCSIFTVNRRCFSKIKQDEE